MNLTLDDASTAVLRDVLDAALRDLHYEIADTDNSRFKGHLKGRAEVLDSIIGKLQGAR